MGYHHLYTQAGRDVSMAACVDSETATEARPKSLSVPKWSPFLRSLSEEIDVLRKEMESVYEKSSGFQSEKLLAISQRLDLKINEFLHYQLN
jgi:hypothetical protein